MSPMLRASSSSEFNFSNSSSAPITASQDESKLMMDSCPVPAFASQSSSSAAPSAALGATFAAGTAATKVNSKRRRISRRPPTTVLEADSANFRSMVQQLTGIPSPPPMLTSLHPARFDVIFRPHPSRGFSFAAPPGLLDAASSLPQFPNSYNNNTSNSFGRLETMSNYRGLPLELQHHHEASLPGIVPELKNFTGQPLYHGAGHSGGGTTLSMPSLWECEAKENAKREVRIDEASGRPPASWSTSL